MPCHVTFTIQDGGGDTAPFSFWMVQDNLETIADLQTRAVAAWDVLKPLINGVLVGVTITPKLDLTAFANNSYAVISDIEEKAIMQFRICVNNRPISISIPTIKESVFVSDGVGKIVDITDTDVVTWGGFMELFPDENGNGTQDSHGNDVCQFLGGYQKFK